MNSEFVSKDDENQNNIIIYSNEHIRRILIIAITAFVIIGSISYYYDELVSFAGIQKTKPTSSRCKEGE